MKFFLCPFFLPPPRPPPMKFFSMSIFSAVETSPGDTIIYKLEEIWKNLQKFISTVSDISYCVFEMDYSVIIPNIKENCYFLFNRLILAPIKNNLMEYLSRVSTEKIWNIIPILEYYGMMNSGLPIFGFSKILETRYVLLRSGSVSIRCKTELFQKINLIAQQIPDLAACKESDIDFTPTEAVQLDNISPQTILHILQYQKIGISENPYSDIIIQEWLSGFDNAVIFELILGANYCDYKELIQATAKNIADKIKGKSPEEIRKTFNIKNDFTPEEEEKVRKDNEWCEER